jgi:glucoamylase
MEGFASCTGLLPEQVWDAPNIPEAHMHLGRPTGSAMPLMWSHSEYIKLLRSAFDGKVYDSIPEVEQRYGERTACELLEIWKPNRRVSRVKPGYTLRVQCPGSFCLRWSLDDWQTEEKTVSTTTTLEIEYVDIAITFDQKAPIRFNFLENGGEELEGRDFVVAID